MVMAWQPIGTASLGSTRPVPMSNGGTRKVHVPQWVHTWQPGGPVRQSCWLPQQSNGDGGRWNGYSKENGPTLWHPYPEAPEDSW